MAASHMLESPEGGNKIHVPFRKMTEKSRMFDD